MTGASIEFSEGYPPMAPSDGNFRLLELFSEVSQELGFGAVRAVNPRNAGAADISFVANHVEMAMDGVGLMGSGGHTLDEVADLRTLGMQTKRVAVLLYRLSQLQ
jgi:glutamate carboxypeptidase